jgi:predicted nuclease of predicted toxin-antitoxin system
MRFLIDMNLSPGTAQWLRSEGHDAVHVLEAGFGALSDPEIFAHAAAESRIVVTFDLDFGEIVGLAKVTGAAVLLLRLRLVRQPLIRERLRVAIVKAAEALQAGAIVLVEDARIRVRRMPPESE